MNVLFLSLSKTNNIDKNGIYPDLLREFIAHGDNVYILSPTEEKQLEKKIESNGDHYRIISVYTGQIRNTNIIKKGVNTLLIGGRYKKAIKKYLKGIKIDLVLYSTPPITLAGVVAFVKKRDRAKTYLLLKDIFPQNALDIGMLRKKGLKGLIYRYFRKKEKDLYRISDKIGCMSEANVEYLLNHNPEINKDIVEVCPNSATLRDYSLTEEEKTEIRKKYNLPLNKKIFVYGGNLGKPQGIPFFIKCLESQRENDDVFFLVVGDGTEFKILSDFEKDKKQMNVKIMHSLPEDEFERLVASCDIGMIFLDYRFTIPNFPSRLLSYMQTGLPVLACTDKATDLGKVVTDNGFGWWCPSNDVNKFSLLVDNILKNEDTAMKDKALKTMKEMYDVRNAYKIIKGC